MSNAQDIRTKPKYGWATKTHDWRRSQPTH